MAVQAEVQRNTGRDIQIGDADVARQDNAAAILCIALERIEIGNLCESRIGAGAVGTVVRAFATGSMFVEADGFFSGETPEVGGLCEYRSGHSGFVFINIVWIVTDAVAADNAGLHTDLFAGKGIDLYCKLVAALSAAALADG